MDNDEEDVGAEYDDDDDGGAHRVLCGPPPVLRPLPSSPSESESLISAIICSNARFSSARFMLAVIVSWLLLLDEASFSPLALRAPTATRCEMGRCLQ
jgi:hypothetical protein